MHAWSQQPPLLEATSSLILCLVSRPGTQTPPPPENPSKHRTVWRSNAGVMTLIVVLVYFRTRLYSAGILIKMKGFPLALLRPYSGTGFTLPESLRKRGGSPCALLRPMLGRLVPTFGDRRLPGESREQGDREMAHRWQRAFSLRTPVTAQAVASPKLCPEQGARHRHASPWAASKTKCTQAHRTHACDMSSSVIAPSTPAHAMLKLPLGLKSTRVTQGKDASARSGTHMMRGREGGEGVREGSDQMKLGFVPV